MESNFISITLDDVTSCSRIKTYEIHVNAFIIVKEVFGGISFRVLAENWHHQKDALVSSSFLVC